LEQEKGGGKTIKEGRREDTNYGGARRKKGFQGEECRRLRRLETRATKLSDHWHEKEAFVKGRGGGSSVGAGEIVAGRDLITYGPELGASDKRGGERLHL